MLSKVIRYILFIISINLFIIGNVYLSFNTMLLATIFMLIVNIIYGFELLNKRIFFLMFNLMIFVFLISRPTIDMFSGVNNYWWFPDESHMFVYRSVFVSLVFLLFGTFIAENINSDTTLNVGKNGGYRLSSIARYKNAWKFVSGFFYYFSLVFVLIVEFEKFFYMHSRNYAELYSSFTSKLPYIFTVIANTNKYFLCFYLASMPKKSSAFIALSGYVISAIPILLIGMRNPIVLNLLFAFLYYFIRDNVVDKKDADKWIGNFEKFCMVSIFPMFIVFLGLFNYLRDDKQVEFHNIFSIMIDFLYRQGVSYDVLCMGHSALPKIKSISRLNYTFGGIIDYFAHNKLAQILFNMQSLGEGNNVKKALLSNSFSHKLAYVTRKQEYLDGHGWGSSYILETYADFGFLGIIIFSIFLGILLYNITKFINSGEITSSIALIILTSIYFCPRAEALGFLNFFIYIQFIAPVTLCFFISKLCIKKYHHNKL